MTSSRKIRLDRRAFNGLPLLALAAPPRSWAQAYPSRPIRAIVNFPPGGPLDLVAREVTTWLADSLKQTIVVENVSGASGHIGAGVVARAEPDGHTILLSIDAPFTSGPWLARQLPYPADALRPVAMLGTTSLLVAAHPSLGVSTLEELVERGRREEITVSTPGIGGPGHFGALLLADLTGIRVNPIHYRGNAPAVMALLSGEVKAGVLATTGLLPHVRSGKIKALAAAGPQRSALLPELKTVAELGYPKFTLQTMFLAMVPSKTQDAVVQKLYHEFSAVMRRPDLQERLRQMDILADSLGPPQTSNALAAARAEYGRIAKLTNMQPE